MRIVSPAFLGLGLVQDVLSQMSVSQYYECQVVWKMDTHRSSHIPVFWIMGVRWMSAEVLQGSLEGYMEVQMHTQELTQDWKVQKS